MRISAEQLAAAAEATGFRADMLERVAQLLGLLDAMQRHPFLRGKLALKGGTALNLFVFDLPRLSVDIDLNYVGAESREAMLEERPRLEEALRAVFGREDLTGRLLTSEHAGGKWTLRYPTASGCARSQGDPVISPGCVIRSSPRGTRPSEDRRDEPSELRVNANSPLGGPTGCSPPFRSAAQCSASASERSAG